MIATESHPLQWLAVVVGAASAAQLTIPTAQAQDRPSHYAIENARLVTVSGQTIDRGTIVIENGVDGWTVEEMLIESSVGMVLN
ncbi:MAG: hypothetical protein IID05_13370 [Gemmatimonadetes bacterium]|nr:hypothetical protein [Gemmatimonadota bacterium]